MLFFLRGVAVFSLCATVVVACSDDDPNGVEAVCDQSFCTDRLDVALDASALGGNTIGSYSLTVEVDGVSGTVDCVPSDLPPTIPLPNLGFDVRCSVREVSLLDAPSDVVITVQADDGSFTGSLMATPAYQTVLPDPTCGGPTCIQASETMTLQPGTGGGGGAGGAGGSGGSGGS